MNVIFAIILLVFGIALCVCAMMFGIKYEEYRKAYIRITLPHSKEFYRKKMKQTLVDDDCNVRHNVVVHRVVFCDTVCMKRKFDKDYAYFILAVLILGLLIIVMTNCAAHK